MGMMEVHLAPSKELNLEPEDQPICSIRKEGELLKLVNYQYVS